MEMLLTEKVVGDGLLLSAFIEHFCAGHNALHALHLLSHSVLMAAL